MDKRKVIIIGGGLAGLTAAIHLSKAGIPVTLFEKNTFPKHKVCGEYISNEVIPYLEFLGIDIESLHPAHITKTSLSTVSGKEIHGKLPLGGFGVSRYAFDNLLYKKALENGCEFINELVSDVSFAHNLFSVVAENSSSEAQIVLGAFGKRSNIDLKLQRKFIKNPSPWLAVKAHYSGEFPDDVVALHNFRGGYCGVSKVETGAINVCYLADFDSFKKYKDIDEYQEKVVGENPKLKAIFKNNKALFKPITISQISFDDKLPVENHMLMIGDTARLIHPLCGNGMAMAMHSAKIASELTIDYFSGKIQSRKALERQYSLTWNMHFRRRIQTGKLLAGILRKQKTSALLMKLLTVFPSAFPAIIKKTHGKPIMN